MRRYLEFALLAVMIGGMSLYLLRALESARSDVEEAVVQADAAAIRINLMEIATRRAMQGGNYPDSDNPMTWLGVPVGHYAGAFDTRPAGSSFWYFDDRQRELIYVFDDGRVARFRLVRNGIVDAGRGAMGGIGLIRLPDRRE